MSILRAHVVYNTIMLCQSTAALQAVCDYPK